MTVSVNISSDVNVSPCVEKLEFLDCQCTLYKRMTSFYLQFYQPTTERPSVYNT